MTHRRIDAFRSRYNELLLDRYLASTREAVANLPDENRMLSPRVVERRDYNAALGASLAVYRALTLAAERLVVDTDLRRRIGLGPHLDAFIELDRAREASIVARLDGFVGVDGVTRFIECNAIIPGAAPRMQRAFASLPITRELAETFQFTSIDPYMYAPAAVAEVQQRRGLAATPSIGIIVPGGVPKGAEKYWLPFVAEQEGWPVVYVDPADVVYRDGTLRARGVAIDLAIVSWGDLIRGEGRTLPMLQAARDGAVHLTHGLSRALVADYKSAFEIISDPEHASLFDEDTQRALSIHVPWTRALRDRKTTYRGTEIDLLRFVLDHREKLVIKPCGALGGTGVVLGWTATEAAWKKAIHVARAFPCVVQERVESGPRETYVRVDSSGAVAADEFTSDLCTFVWNGSVADGAISRCATGGILNQSGGGYVAPLWVLEP